MTVAQCQKCGYKVVGKPDYSVISPDFCPSCGTPYDSRAVKSPPNDRAVKSPPNDRTANQ